MGQNKCFEGAADTLLGHIQAVAQKWVEKFLKIDRNPPKIKFRF